MTSPHRSLRLLPLPARLSLALLLFFTVSACALFGFDDDFGFDVPIDADHEFTIPIPLGQIEGSGQASPTDADIPLPLPPAPVDLASASSELNDKKDLLESIEIIRIDVTPLSNSLTTALPPIDLYVGPDGATSAAQGIKIATIPSIPAGSLAAVQGVIDEDGMERAQQYIRTLNFTFVPDATIHVNAGDPIPGGDAELNMYLKLRATVDPTKWSDSEEDIASGEFRARFSAAPSEERSRALTKAARVLSRIRPGDPLRAHTRKGDNSLRRAIVRLVYEGDEETLLSLLREPGDGAARTIYRVVGNLRRIESPAAALMARCVIETLGSLISASECARVLARLLRGLRLEDTTLSERAELHLGQSLDDETHVWLLWELLAFELRIEPDSDQILRTRVPHRRGHLPDSSAERLLSALDDSRRHWSRRLAALWLLWQDETRRDGISRRLDDAFHSYPLQALAAVDQIEIALAVEGEGVESMLAPDPG